MTCPFYVRWWHRRLRKLDRQVILSALLTHESRSPFRFSTASRLWDGYRAQPGQEHWSCPCAKSELLERVKKGLNEL